MSHDKLGEILVAYDAISAEQLDVVLREQRLNNLRLGDILRLKRAVDEDQLRQALTIQALLRGKNRYKQTLAMAEMATSNYNRRRVIEKRQELRRKADKITDEYPAILAKKRG